jgi:hypothetical protein
MYLFNKFLQKAYYVPSSVLGNWRFRNKLSLLSWASLVQEMINTYANNL